MDGRIHGGRITALVMAVGAVALIAVSTQLDWITVTSPLSGKVQIKGLSVGLVIEQSGGLEASTATGLSSGALTVLVCSLIALVPGLRLAALGAIVAGVAYAAIGLDVLAQFQEPPDGLLEQLAEVFLDHSPGPGPFVLIAGGSLAVMSGLVTVLTPRTTSTGTMTRV